VNPERRNARDLVRWLTKIDMNGPLAKNRPDLGRCWLWNGGHNNGGYAKFSVTEDDAFLTVYAHRWGYKRIVGPVDDDLEMDHFACDNRGCVNPLHVRPATSRENTMRSNARSAINARKTHCKRGHPFDETNTYFVPNGRGRHCKACAEISRLARRAARR
jgi:hypothetical protein